MNQLSWVRRIKGIGRSVVHWGLGTALDGGNLRALSAAPHPRGKVITSAVRGLQASLPASERAIVETIEAARQRLLQRKEPLADGSLPVGPYDDGVTVAAACGASKPKKSALFLYHLARELQPDLVIELGTNVGISSAYLASALRKNGKGRLVTLEASPYRIRCAKEVHASVGLKNVTYVQGLFADTLAPTLREIGAVDFAFIDGHHQYQPTLDYFQVIHAHAARNATYVFDDIRWSEGMLRAWKEIQRDDRLTIAADFHTVGVCVAAGDEARRRYTSPPIYRALL